MVSGFKFEFGGDDIDEEVTESQAPKGIQNDSEGSTEPGRNRTSQINRNLRARSIPLDDLLAKLPSQISYNTFRIRLRTEQESYVSVARREVFDTQAQLMAEATDVEETGNKALADKLKTYDVIAGVYEGGGKTWESSADLAAVVATDYSFLLSEDVEEIRLIELGSGPAIPALTFVRRVFQNHRPSTPPKRKIHFVLSDKEDINLGLVTVANVLLTWYLSRNPDAEPKSDVEIDSQLLDDFRADLKAYGVSFTFISESWCPQWADLAFPPPTETPDGVHPVGRGYTLVFSSETIYNAETVPQFVETLVTLLDRAAQRHPGTPASQSVENVYRNPKAVISAKKLYFGLNGGVDHFMAELKDIAGERVSVTQKADISDEGVGRGVWEVELTGRKT